MRAAVAKNLARETAELALIMANSLGALVRVYAGPSGSVLVTPKNGVPAQFADALVGTYNRHSDEDHIVGDLLSHWGHD